MHSKSIFKPPVQVLDQVVCLWVITSCGNMLDTEHDHDVLPKRASKLTTLIGNYGQGTTKMLNPTVHESVIAVTSFKGVAVNHREKRSITVKMYLNPLEEGRRSTRSK